MEWDPEQTLIGALEAAAERHADRCFLRFDDGDLTYGRLADAAARVAAGLISLGVGAGSRVCSLLHNTEEAAIAWMAANWLGAVYVPINTATRRSFLAHQLTDANPDAIVVADDLIGQLLDVERAPDVPIVIVGDPSGDDGYVPFGELATAPAVAPARLDATDLTAMLYTSGTTGPSKGCLIPHRYLCHGGSIVLWGLGRRPDEVQWNCLPMFHMHAMAATFTATLLLGATSVVAPRFSLSQFWDRIEASRAAITFVIGPIAHLVATAPDTEAMARCRGRLRVVRGAPFPPETAAIWRERFGVAEACVGGYGLTEASPVASMPPAASPPPGAAGLAAPDFELRIVDDDGAVLPPDTVGEIAVRPGHDHIMFDGYWQRPEATAERWSDGWFHTGDLGRLDEDGYLYFVDRKKDCIRRRGENISSVEVEQVVLEHPAVVEAAVHAVPSALGEDDVKVHVVLADGRSVDHRELAEWITERVPAFARPSYLEFRAALPRNAIGRIMKYQLREQGVTDATYVVDDR